MLLDLEDEVVVGSAGLWNMVYYLNLVLVYGLGDRLHIVDNKIWNNYLEYVKGRQIFAVRSSNIVRSLCGVSRFIDYADYKLDDVICKRCLAGIMEDVRDCDHFLNIIINDCVVSELNKNGEFVLNLEKLRKD